MKELIVEAKIDHVDLVVDFINAELALHDCSQELVSQIDTAVDEAFVNIAKYAYSPPPGAVTVSIAIGNEARIRFQDAGKPFNPLEHTRPDLSKPLPQREIGGLGIFLVRQLMDRVEYEYAEGKNILTLVKGLARPSG